MDKKIRFVIDKALDLPTRKILHVSFNKDLLIGAYSYLAHYGYELKPALAEIFIRELEIKLVGHEEIEYEWAEEQWEACEYLKTLGSEIVHSKYKGEEVKIIHNKYEPQA